MWWSSSSPSVDQSTSRGDSNRSTNIVAAGFCTHLRYAPGVTVAAGFHPRCLPSTSRRRRMPTSTRRDLSQADIAVRLAFDSQDTVIGTIGGRCVRSSRRSQGPYG
jgi:hypothetical protein